MSSQKVGCRIVKNRKESSVTWRSEEGLQNMPPSQILRNYVPTTLSNRRDWD